MLHTAHDPEMAKIPLVRSFPLMSSIQLALNAPSLVGEGEIKGGKRGKAKEELSSWIEFLKLC